MEEKPLSGMTIAVPRAREQAADLADPLARAGARVVVAPTIAFVPRLEAPEVEAALARLSEYDAFLFTSTNAVRFFARALEARGVELPPEKEIYAIGPATARSIEAQGWGSPLVPETHEGEATAEAILSRRRGGRLLFPRAARAREILPERLTEAGIDVTLLTLYETHPSSEGKRILSPLLWGGALDLVTFTSASTVRNLVEAFRAAPDPEALSALWRVPAACIGPVTANAARRHGFHVSIEPPSATIPALVAAIVAERKKRPEGPR